MSEESQRLVVFAGARRIAEGDRATVTEAAWRVLEADAAASVLVFDLETGRVVDLDPREGAGTVEAPVKRGRPKLGVTAREVTLLPRHWDWLAQQPGGASVALRKLVEAARTANADADQARGRREAAYRFMQTMAGDLPGFEEASRALFAGDPAGLAARTADWPQDVRDQVMRLIGRS